MYKNSIANFSASLSLNTTNYTYFVKTSVINKIYFKFHPDVAKAHHDREDLVKSISTGFLVGW